MKKTNYSVLLGLLLVFASVPAAQAQGSVSEITDGVDSLLKPTSDSGSYHSLRTSVSTKFSDDQLERLYKIKTDFADKSSAKMAELKTQEQTLQDLLTQSDFDKNKAQTIQSKINALNDDLANLNLDRQVSVLNCLTPNQRKELRRNSVNYMGDGVTSRSGGRYCRAFSDFPLVPGGGFGMGRGFGGGGRGPGGPNCPFGLNSAF